MKKIIKAAVSIFLSVSALISVPEVSTAYETAYSDEEIEARIDSVGKEYLDFLKRGYEEEYDESFAVSSAKSSGGINLFQGAVEDVTSLMGMPAGEYDMEAAEEPVPVQELPWNTSEFTAIDESGFVSVSSQPFSTFGADVDTASYSLLRRGLMEPAIYSDDPMETVYDYPPVEENAIRIEEMMNYFKYSYKEPEDGEKFGVSTELVQCPWNEDTLLLMAGIKAEEIEKEDKGSNIVFLIDTSGSMFSFDKLPLVKKSMKILASQLDEKDIVSVVTYAGNEEVLLSGVKGNDYDTIEKALDQMEAWGGTYGEGGINKAYEVAEKYFIEGGNNRVVLCTDGDFNLGVSSEAGLEELIKEKKETGVFFSCLGFGMGNYSDTRMETLADKGNGNYFYIDCEREAQRALEEEFFSTIYTIAKDAKFQVEFNPETVKGYRLIGYENRGMAAEDFDDDTKDGGEIGSGQTVTVLYEIVPVSSEYEIPEIQSKYNHKKEQAEAAAGELLTVNIRYKEPDEDESILREYTVSTDDMQEDMGKDMSWAAGVAQAGMLMRDSQYAGSSTFGEIYSRLKEDPEIMDNDYKAEFLYMLRLMKRYKETYNNDVFE